MSPISVSPKPTAPEDTGRWRCTLPGNPPEEADIRWDERGFAFVYLDGVRQLPVYVMDDAVWERVSENAGGEGPLP